MGVKGHMELFFICFGTITRPLDCNDYLSIYGASKAEIFNKLRAQPTHTLITEMALLYQFHAQEVLF